jgi:predicted PurR-regulated permease PerM
MDMVEADVEPIAPAGGSPVVPPWLKRLGAVSWRLLVVIALGAVLAAIAFTISLVSATIVISLVIAATFAPLVLALRARGWPNALAAAVVTGSAVLVLGAVVALVALAFAPYVSEVIQGISSGIAEAKTAIAGAGLSTDAVDSVNQAVTQVEGWVKANVDQIAGAIAGVVTVAILSIFLVFFLLSDGNRAWVWMLSTTSDRDRGQIESSGHRALARVGGYLRGMAILASVMALVEFLFLVILGVPLAAPLAVLVFLGGFIPYVGGLVTTVVLVAVAAGSSGPQTATILLILIGALTFVRGKVLQPMIYGRSVDLHPAVVLLALPVGASVAGVVGLFAVIPVVAFLMAVTGSIVAAIGPADPTTDPEPLEPPWLDRLAQWSWRILAALALLYVGILLATQVPIVVLPLVIGLVLASTLAGLVGALQRRGRGRAAAAAIATAGMTLGVIFVVVIALSQIAGPMHEAIATAVQGGSIAAESGGAATGWVNGTTAAAASSVVGTIDGLLAGLAGVGVVLILGVLLTFYFLRDGDRIWGSLISRLRPWRRRAVGEAGSRSVGVLGGYMAGTAVVSAVGALSQYLIMTVLGLPYAIPIAILSFFLCFIPYIGGFITTGAAFLIAVAAGDTTVVVIMAIWTVVFNIVQGNIVSPLVYGRTVQLHPAIVLLAIPAGGEIAGVIGMFLVVPFLGVVAASWRTILQAAGETPTVEPTSGPGEALPDEASPSGSRSEVEGRGATTGGAIEPA